MCVTYVIMKLRSNTISSVFLQQTNTYTHIQIEYICETKLWRATNPQHGVLMCVCICASCDSYNLATPFGVCVFCQHSSVCVCAKSMPDYFIPPCCLLLVTKCLSVYK